MTAFEAFNFQHFLQLGCDQKNKYTSLSSVLSAATLPELALLPRHFSCDHHRITVVREQDSTRSLASASSSVDVGDDFCFSLKRKQLFLYPERFGKYRQVETPAPVILVAPASTVSVLRLSSHRNCSCFRPSVINSRIAIGRVNRYSRACP